MARERRRLLIAPERLADGTVPGGRIPLAPGESHYLARVLRLRPGEVVAVIDGCGGLWQARRGEGDWLVGLERSPGSAADPPSPSLTLALALPRQEVELVWRMATELGIDRLQPLIAERCQGAGRREPMERWQTILREASEQCERLWLPRLESLQPAGGWLLAQGSGVRLLATTRRESLPPLESVLDQCRREGATLDAVQLAVGPEGGWSPKEEEGAERVGWRPVSLGETILRCTTAAVAGVSRLVAWRQISC